MGKIMCTHFLVCQLVLIFLAAFLENAIGTDEGDFVTHVPSTIEKTTDLMYPPFTDVTSHPGFLTLFLVLLTTTQIPLIYSAFTDDDWLILFDIRKTILTPMIQIV